MEKAIFLDKDGTLVHDIPYNVDPARLRFNEGAIAALAKLKREGYLLIMVSNQSGVAHGYFTEQSLGALANSIQEKLECSGLQLDDFCFCPHHPHGRISNYAQDCDCRKPKPGLLLRAAEKFNIDLSCSWMIGDILNDVEAGTNAGCKTILLNNGNETEWVLGEKRKPTAIAGNLLEAAEIIVNTK